MGRLDIQPTGRERFFPEDEIIVSKTDLTGKITYANRTFQEVAGYREEELLGQPHSLIRHPDMPRAVFAYLWQTIAAGEEVFAYVKNMAKSGDHYWVFAHVTPTFDPVTRAIVSYHSSRRVPSRRAVDAAAGVYALLLAEEARHTDRRAGLAASLELLKQTLEGAGMEYERFVWTLDPAVAQA
ncbi:MAG: PAS domain-containing protein [Gemmatimonadetes bacterium]|nr:PAS domain-containing protein [Gemmatimonadota bacterium]MCC7134252.1 PAS domain-containing protein [Gemmatimonadales bacterium]